MNDLRGAGPIERVDVSLYQIPTERPESDGTLAWDHTICIVAEVTGGGRRGIGYTYAPPAAARLIRDTLASEVEGVDAFAVGAAYDRMALPLSAHTAPSIHVHPCCALTPVRHLEYFHDHVRVEGTLFEGAPRPRARMLSPDLSRPGLGLELKRADAARFAADGA